MTSKLTNADYYKNIKAYFAGEDMDERVTNEGIMEFCEKQIAALESRAEKARVRAAEKRAQGDALLDAVYAALTDEFQSRADVNALIDAELEPTVAKVGYRLTRLVNEGRAVKEEATVAGPDGKAKRVAVYKLAE